MNRWWVGCLLSMVAGTAHASDPAHRLPWHRRPYAAVRVITGGFPDLYGASASLYVPRPLALEGGISRGAGDRGSWYARVGPEFSLREPRPRSDVAAEQVHPEERYPTYDVLVQPMGGFRWYEDGSGPVHQTFAGPTFTTEVDVMVWANAKTAVDFQLSTGGTYWMDQSDPEALSFMPELRLAAGFAF